MVQSILVVALVMVQSMGNNNSGNFIAKHIFYKVHVDYILKNIHITSTFIVYTAQNKIYAKTIPIKKYIMKC